MLPPREDWAAVMDCLLEGDRLAYVKWSRLVAGMLASWRAYDFREEWPDLVHEILMAAVQGVRSGRVRERGATLAYVRAIARNKFNKRLTHHLERGEGEMESVEEVDPEGEPRADPALLAEVRRALDKLPKAKADVVLGVYGFRRTYEQVAQDLGIPLGTVKRYLREGLEQLRRLLGGPHGIS